MKRVIVLLLLLAVALTGCGETASLSHPEWDENWVRIGQAIGVEPVENFTLSESKDVLSLSGIYYAAWSCGEGQEFVNADGDDAIVYDAQIYVLLQECDSADAAQEEVTDWIAQEKEYYETGNMEKKTFGDQEFDILPLLSGSEDNPYGSGIAAFTVRGKNAIIVELVCSDRYTGDSQSVLAQFLSGFHYSEEE